ncbi:MAG: family 10 glycosylhydrolase [Candidatus Omnitrophica bacterium]|nr:family 10 glycosylhydrolase [Candidatus Omnitrophota bacterium]
MTNKRYFLMAIFFTLFSTALAGGAGTSPRLGAWITVFTPENVFYSRENADKLVRTCKEAGIDHIYLQLYRAGEAFYDSAITVASPFEKIKKSFGGDPVKYIIDAAKKNGIEVHAWLNLLSVAQNDKADVLLKIGPAALTLDQNEKKSWSKEKEAVDKRFVREDQLFLEPGNPQVRTYLTSIVGEILDKYPSIAGVHLDYIRYPKAVPFSPGSRFDAYSLSYGYTFQNMLNFKKDNGATPKEMEKTRDNFQKWDDWRRRQVTELARMISGNVRAREGKYRISAAVMPSAELAYSVNFQDWPDWLRKGYIDHVVTMNYTENPELAGINARSSLSQSSREKVYIGLGAYLLKSLPGVLKEEIETVKKASPGGIVIFSYDEVAKDAELRQTLRALSNGPKMENRNDHSRGT